MNKNDLIKRIKKIPGDEVYFALFTIKNDKYVFQLLAPTVDREQKSNTMSFVTTPYTYKTTEDLESPGSQPILCNTGGDDCIHPEDEIIQDEDEGQSFCGLCGMEVKNVA